jgi:hypothetical protein
VIWLNTAVKPKFSWPNKSIELTFENKKLVLSPITDEHAPAVSLYDDAGITFEAGGTFLCRFLSRLAWSMDAGISNNFFTGSNNPEHPGLLGRLNYPEFGWLSCEPWQQLYIPKISTPLAELAIALYREGMSVDSIPFSFLSFFKILNIQHKNGGVQQTWINDNLNKVSGVLEIQRLQELQISHQNIGKYLYEQGRCAVAHAYNTPIVNPDNYSDSRRLELDLPLIKELANIYIEDEFGVLTKYSFSNQFSGKVTDEALIKSESNGVIKYKLWTP